MAGVWEAVYGCFCKSGVLFVGVLVQGALLFQVCTRPLMFGNSHMVIVPWVAILV